MGAVSPPRDLAVLGPRRAGAARFSGETSTHGRQGTAAALLAATCCIVSGQQWGKRLVEPGGQDRLIGHAVLERDRGLRIFEEMLLVASGKPCRAEILGFNDFAIKRIGPSM